MADMYGQACGPPVDAGPAIVNTARGKVRPFRRFAGGSYAQALARLSNLTCTVAQPILSPPLRSSYPLLPSVLSSRSASRQRAATMAESMEGVVTEVEQPNAENVEEKTVAGEST